MPMEEPLGSSHMQYLSSESDEEEDPSWKNTAKENYVENNTPNFCRSMLYTCQPCGYKVVDPRTKWVKEWNRVFLLVCVLGLFVDPLFFYPLSISEAGMCLFVDGWFAITVTILRGMIDAFYVWNMWLQHKIDRRHYYQPRVVAPKAGSVMVQYLKDKNGFLLDLLVILPVLQITLWIIVPYMLKERSVTLVMSVFLVVFLLQYFVKIYHTICLLGRMQNLSGYIFGTVWWGIVINLVVYFIAAHAAGACWYLIGLRRSITCLSEQCESTSACNITLLACKDHIYYGTTNILKGTPRLAWAANSKARHSCLDYPSTYDYGGLSWCLRLVTNDSRLEKFLYPIFWGLMILSTFGNTVSSTEWLEVVFNIIILIIGVLLLTMLIGNIKEFLTATRTKKQNMQSKMRNIEGWMSLRRLPLEFRQRIRNYERQKWAATRGVDESEIIKNLPEGLRRDIKYHLCLDLVRQVPLFQHMDDLVLENICDRVKSLIFTKGEIIQTEGDPVQRMLFFVRGRVQSSQVLRDGLKSYCMLGPGNFSGDELLSWCLKRPFIERLPPSSSTLLTLETTEAFGLEAEDVNYITQHFRYTFVSEKLRRSARYYSPGWRTWAAVAIQLAWRKYKRKQTLPTLSFIRPVRPLSRTYSIEEDKLRLYSAMLSSAKPHQDDYDF